MPLGDNTSTLDLVENWPYDFQHIDDGDPQYAYLDAYASEMRRIDTFIDELYDQLFISSASGRELEKLGAEVGVVRDAGETDATFRYRVQLGTAIAASDGTADDIRTILILAFGEDALDGIDVAKKADEPVIQFIIPSNHIDDSPLSITKFESLLEDAFPCGYGVEALRGDTLILGQSGNQGVGGKLI